MRCMTKVDLLGSCICSLLGDVVAQLCCVQYSPGRTMVKGYERSCVQYSFIVVSHVVQ